MIGPLLSALLLTLSLPPHPLPLLAPVALAPLAFHLERLPATAAGTRSAAMAGIVVGGGHAVLLLHWLPGAALPLMGPAQGVAAAFAVWGLAAALTGVGLALVHRGTLGGRLPLPLSLGAAWIALGWVPASLPTVGFPWLGLEAALVDRPELLGLADLVGGIGVAGLLALTGGALGQWAARWPGRGEGDPGNSGPVRRAGWVVLAGLLLAGGAGYGFHRAGQLAFNGEDIPGDVLRVAALSLEADPDLLTDRELREQRLPAGIHRLSRELGPGEADFVLWPESPTGMVDGPMEPALARHWARRSGTPVIFGALAARSEEGRANRILLASSGPSPDPGGALRVVREKRRLVPIVERAYARGLRAGGRPPPVEGPFRWWPESGSGLPGEPQAGALICFEALFAGEAFRLRRRGARILLLPTNEGWLVGPGGGVLDSARRQHRAAAVLRAVETRSAVVRSAVGGPAGAWSAIGQPVPGQARSVEGVGHLYLGMVRPGPERAPLAARGGAAATGLAAVLLLLGGASLPSRNRPPRSRV